MIRPARRATLALAGALLVLPGCGDDGIPEVVAASSTGVPASVSTSTTTTSTTTTTTTSTTSTTSTTTTLVVPPTVEPEVPDQPHDTYRYGPFVDNLLDLHEPTAGTAAPGAHPAIVYLHSGGWVAGSRANLPDFVSAQLERGWSVVALDYRLAPIHPFPAAHEDVDRALRWLRLNGPGLGVDPESLVVIGTSAGGDLALAAAAAPDRFVADGLPPRLAGPAPLIAGVVSVSGPSDLAALYAQPVGFGHPVVGAYLACGDLCTDEQLRAASVLSMVEPDPAPALLIFGALDTLMPSDVHGYPLAGLWEQAGGTATVWVAPEYGHNLALDAGIDPAAFAGWLDAAVGR